jgi:tetratricopeptide (TPR) repeat protein
MPVRTPTWRIEASDVASLGEAQQCIKRSLDTDDGDAWSHGVYAQLLFLLCRDDEAEFHFKHALALNPNDADVAAVFANILMYWGRWREALTWIDTAKRLNPLPPTGFMISIVIMVLDETVDLGFKITEQMIVSRAECGS